MLLTMKTIFCTDYVEDSTEKEAIMEKKRIRRLQAVVLAVIMCFSVLGGIPMSGSISQAKDYTNGGCVQWVKDRTASVLGITLPPTGMNEFGLYGANNYWRTLNYNKGSEPAKYSLAVWKYNNAGANSSYGKYGHVAFVEDVSGNNVTVTEGGCSGYSYAGNTGVIHRTVSKSKMATLGGCSGFYGYIYLTGSASAPSASVSYSQLNTTFVDTWNAVLHGRIENPSRLTISQVGVWIWDSAGNLVVDHKENCGLSTSYVDQNLNVVSEAKADGLRSGETYTYQMYANANGAIYKSGTGSFTVKDGEKPVISDVKVYNITSEGYTVSCVVTDNFAVDRVQFPTWTTAGDQDDIQRDWGSNSAVSGTRNGNTFTYQVKISDHNNERGSYRTHIYAYDKAGNCSAIAAGNNIIVPEVVSVATPTPVVTPQPTVAPLPAVTPQPTKDTTVSTDDGEDDDTDTASAQVEVTAPKKVTLIGAISISKKTMNAYWTRNNGAYGDGYQVQYAKNKKFTKAVTKNVSISKTEIKIKKLTSKKAYYVRVRVYKNSARGKVYSPWSNVGYCWVR